MKKGFTLIELLAAITIMAILLLVGIPAISSTIFKSRKNTVETSVKSYANEVNKEILAKDKYQCGIYFGGNCRAPKNITIIEKY